MAETVVETGTVKWFNTKKGYGFIVCDVPPDAEKREIFFHATDLAKAGIRDEEVDEGHRLSFQIAETPRGKKATEIVKL